MNDNVKNLLRFFSVLVIVSSCSKDDLRSYPSGQTQPYPVSDPIQDSTPVYTPYYDYDNIIPGAVTVGHLSEPSVDLASAVCNDRFYYATYDHMDIFDPLTNSLSRKDFQFDRTSMAAASCGRKVMFAGGMLYNPTNLSVTAKSKVDIYNTDTGEWMAADLSVARYGVITITHNNKVFFAGGSVDVYTASDRIDIYDASSNSWSTAQLSAKCRPVITVVGKKLWFAIPGTDKIDIYDPDSNTWTTQTVPTIIAGTLAVSLKSKVFFTGSRDINVYDTASNSWSVLTLSERKFLVPVGVSNDKIAFIGGMTSWFVYSTTIEIYDPFTNKWTISGMKADLYYSAIISHDNYIYIAGGFINQENNMLDRIYRFSL